VTVEDISIGGVGEIGEFANEVRKTSKLGGI